ncbi:MAG TPA: MlaD family protein [Stellaceae bacterium]|nr:MlaD family protein [Stellaceae bacterium]
METRAANVAVGSFVLILLAGVVIAVLWFARVQVGEGVNFYDIYFTGSVAGLDRGSTVRQNGVPIGRVTDIKLDPQNPKQVRVTVRVDQDVEIKSDAIAALELVGLTGGEQIDITGGSRDAPPLERKGDERYPVIASTTSGLQQVVTSAPELLARAMALMDQASDLLNEHNRAAIAQTLDNLRQVTAAAAGHSDEIGSAIADGAAAAHDLRDTLAHANEVIAELRRMAAPGGNLDGAIKDLDRSAQQLAEIEKHLDGLVQENRPAIRDFTQRGLTELQQLIEASNGLVADLSRLADSLERDPSRFLFGDRRQGYQPK